MEDLGRIQIDIRESVSAGGGGGGGGGRAGEGERRADPQPAAVKSSLAQLVSVLSTTKTAMSEMASLVRAPSATGFMSAVSAGSAPMQVAGMLGLSGATATLAVGAVAGIAVAAGLAIKGMEMLGRAAAQVADRIAAVTRFSGTLMVASAQERLAAFNRLLREAALNGQMYAWAQRESTIAANATSDAMIEWNRLLSYGSVLYSRFLTIIMRLLEPMLRFANLLAKMTLTSGIGDTIWSAITLAFKVAVQSIMSVLGPFGSMVGSFIGMFGSLIDWLANILNMLGIIATNTKPQVQSSVNDWFLADVQAITGSSYQSLGVGGRPAPSGTRGYRNTPSRQAPAHPQQQQPQPQTPSNPHSIPYPLPRR